MTSVFFFCGKSYYPERILNAIRITVKEKKVGIPSFTLKCVIEVFTAEMRGGNDEHQIHIFIQVINCVE